MSIEKEERLDLLKDNTKEEAMNLLKEKIRGLLDEVDEETDVVLFVSKPDKEAVREPGVQATQAQLAASLGRQNLIHLLAMLLREADPLVLVQALAELKGGGLKPHKHGPNGECLPPEPEDDDDDILNLSKLIPSESTRH